MNINPNLNNLIQRKKSVVLTRQSESNKIFKYIGGDSVIYKDLYVQSGTTGYAGHIYETGDTLSVNSQNIELNAASGVALNGDLIINSDLIMNSGNLDLSCNLIQDVSGIYFCDGTYIGSGSSFDISSNQVLVLSGKQDPSGAYNGSSIVSKDRIYQQLNSEPSWNAVNGYYALSKDAYPALNPSSFSIQSVSTWTQRTFVNQNTQTLRSVCWSPQLKLFVAVGGAGGGNDRIVISPDGINWTLSALTYLPMRSVCWSAETGLFVAVGLNGTNGVITSPDGITWTARTSAGPVGSGLFWLSVCWSPELSLFVAVAYIDFLGTTTNRVMTSPDGITWTLRTSPNNNWYSVCWSPELGLFVATSEDNSIMTSPDGITWTTRTSPVSNKWYSVCWSPELGLFVAVGSAGNINTKIITSPDGINWTARTGANNNSYSGVCWSAELGLFVAVGYGSDASNNRIMTSSNGINWTARTNSNSLLSVCWSPELGIFVASSISAGLETSSLRGRPPTSYNVFDSSFNNIDSSGNWTFNRIQFSTNNGVRIGQNSGLTNQGTNAIAIGVSAGSATQGSGAIAIGVQAGQSAQGVNSIAIGSQTGATQGANAIHLNASGLGATVPQASQSIALNASTSVLNTVTQQGFYVNPIRTSSNPTANTLLAYDSTTREVYNCAKTFVIDHPNDQNKYLVHACLEGPEAGVYYRGKSEIINGEYTTIHLPDYLPNLAVDFTIQINPIFEGKFTQLQSTEIVDNKFEVHSKDGNAKFHWHVYGKRNDIVVEPSKKDVTIKGNGPYTWIE
jgi:hypothetical protein